ncbi:MAG: hypothetical protein HQL99_10690 [Magnetococcales bacterium]|nr:hypothetical protein [Magnetococcales bacterium]
MMNFLNTWARGVDWIMGIFARNGTASIPLDRSHLNAIETVRSFARGNLSLQNGCYQTETDRERLKKELAGYRFSDRV